MRKLNPILLTLIIFLYAIPSRGQNISYLGSTLWSGVCDVKIQGNYAYCAFFNGLVILDITNPTNPTFVSQYYIGGNASDYSTRVGQRLDISGNYVYFAADNQGLNILDVSNPVEPVLTYRYETPGYATCAYISGSYAYVGGGGTLDILDVTNPNDPIFLGRCDSINVLGIYVRDNYAYAACGSNGLKIIDVANPANPTVLGSYGNGDYAIDIQVVENYAFLAYGWDGLVIIDISDPTNPTLAGQWSDPLNVWADGVFISGDYAYLATNGHFITIDIADYNHPALVSSYGVGWNLDVYVLGNYAFVAAFTNGLHVINITDPTNPVLESSYSVPVNVKDVFVTGNYAFVAAEASGLYLIDITNSTNPTVISRCILHDPVFGTSVVEAVYVSGNYAYAGTYYGLNVVNIADPHNPVQVSNLQVLGGEDIFVRGSYAYLANYIGLNVIDINDPLNPQIIGNYPTPNLGARGVYVREEYAYVAARTSFQILNISDPANPTFVGSWADNHGDAVNVRVLGDYAYLVDGGNLYDGLQIINISDPFHPAPSGFYQAQGSADDVYILGSYAYLADAWTSRWTQGLEVVNISDPTNPTLTESLNTAGNGWAISVSGSNIYLADQYSLMILNSNITDIKNDDATPDVFSLSQNYPNPFNASTTIKYDLPKSSDVSIDIYDILGRKIERLVSGKQSAGAHSAIWNAKDASSGVYFYKLQAGDYIDTKRCLLLK